MLHSMITTGQAVTPGSLTFCPARNAAWAVTPGGDLIAVRLFDQQLTMLGSGYLDPVAVTPLPDGLRLAVAEAGGAVYVARRDSADRADALLLCQAPGGVLAAGAHPDPGRLLILAPGSLDGGTSPQLLTCDVSTGELLALASDLHGATSLTVNAASRQAVVLSRLPDETRTLTFVDLDAGTATAVTGLPAYERLTASPDPAQPGVLASRTDPVTGPHLALLNPAGAEVASESIGAPVDALTTWGSLVLAASGPDLIALEWGLDAGALPLTSPLGPLYVGGYARLTADLPAAGLNSGDVAYTVREGPFGGSTSAGLQPPDRSGSESVMLLAGVHAGEFHLEATLVADGSLLSVRRFRVTTLWPDDVAGPPIAITGDHQSYLMSWGGSGGIGGYIKPAPSLWRVLVVLVSLKDRAWGGLDGPARVEWQDRVTGGTESARRFYEEVSAFKQGVHGMTVELIGNQVFGPALVDAGWGDVFKPKEQNDVNAGWLTKPTGYAALAGAISDFFADLPGGADFLAQADTVSVVVRSGSDAPIDMGPNAPKLPTRYVWGHANPEGVALYRKTATTYTQFKRPFTVMTDQYPPGAPVRNRTFTLCHELGHTLGLSDLYDANNDYPAEINARQTGGVDLMSDSQDLPHFSLANRLRLGWVDRQWLRRFEFSASPVGGSVVLQATETLTGAGPVAGQVAGIEVPIFDDWSYLFEYRREQPGQIGDQRLETSVVTGRTQILVGTDLRVRGGDVARPPIIRLGDDLDGDGPVLVNNGQDYQDSDTTNPERMHDFILTLDAIASPGPDSAKVDVKYLEAHRPQLQVRPAPGYGNFKSPDIELIGPFGANVRGAVKGMPNVIQITVHNLGSLPASQAQIHVRWLPFTVTPGTWRDLPDPAPFSVPARGLTAVAVPWNIPASVKVKDVEAEHFCVRVDIDRYLDPAHPDHEEIVVGDNWAQSNFDTKPVGFGSPSDRVATVATATNTLGRPSTYLFNVHQTTDWYRVFLGHAWLELGTNQTEAMELAYESLAGDPELGAAFEEHIETITSVDHQVAITSSVMPEGTECDTPRTVFGAGLTLRAGRRTVIDRVNRDLNIIVAEVHATSNGVTFPVTFGEFHLAAWTDEDPIDVAHTQGQVSNGFGQVLMTDRTFQDLRDGRRVWFSLARPGDSSLAAAVTGPALLM
jgi:M6 family metalloprotease-like protein